MWDPSLKRPIAEVMSLMPLTLHRASLARAQEGSEMQQWEQVSPPETAGAPAGITAFWGQLPCSAASDSARLGTHRAGLCQPGPNPAGLGCPGALSARTKPCRAGLSLVSSWLCSLHSGCSLEQQL